MIPIEREVAKYRKYARPFHPIRFLNLLPLSHMFGQSMATFVPPMLRGTVVFSHGYSPTEILLVLLGRAYAAAAGLVESDAVTNDELVRMVKGTPGGQRWALTKLRQENLVATATRGSHHLLPSQVGRAMKAIKEKAAPEAIP